MISKLIGGQYLEVALTKARRKTIESLSLNDNVLRFTFTDGSKLRVYDNGQSCCESRYMQTDDTLGDFVGANLLGVEVRETVGGSGEHEEEHEVQFLIVATSKGSFTAANYNDHNGYYGGFSIEAAFDGG